jgi:integrative and conjugative element protein (TIGR02256 family)
MPESLGLVWLSATTVEIIINESNWRFPKETGGVLIGYWADQDKTAVVTHVTGPGPNAIHEPYSFTPDDEYQVSEIAKHYNDSGRLRTYLGDWHTHPVQNAYLSKTDRQTLRKIALHKAARCPRPLMAVIGNGPNWDIKFWRYKQTRFGRLSFASNAEPVELKTF